MTHDARRAEPGQEFTYNDADGTVVTMKADDDGIVHPKNDGQVRAADAFGLKVARSAMAEEKKASARKTRAEKRAEKRAAAAAAKAAEPAETTVVTGTTEAEA